MDYSEILTRLESSATKYLNDNKEIIETAHLHLLKVSAMDLIVNPRFNLTTFVNRNETYLQAKIYWITPDGNIKRTVSTTLGNMSNYPNGYHNEEALKMIKKDIQYILYKKYIKTFNHA